MCYSICDTGFDSRSLFLTPDFDWDKNVIIFCVGNSSSTHTDKKKLILVEGPTQGSDDQRKDQTTLQ